MTPAEPAAELLDRRVEDDGVTIELFRRGNEYEVWRDGRRVIASDARRSEQSLVELAVAPLRGRDDVNLLVAGLGMGFSLRAALDAPGVKVLRVDVIERSQAIIDWNEQHFAQLNSDAGKDPRVKVHHADLATFAKQVRLGAGDDLPPQDGGGWFAVVLDVDEGPSGLWRAENAGIYDEEGVARLEGLLRPGGVLALWSAQREPDLHKRMHARLTNVAEMVVPVEINGQSNLDYIYRGRRAAPPPQKPAN
jgi:spermidine synthase